MSSENSTPRKKRKVKDLPSVLIEIDETNFVELIEGRLEMDQKSWRSNGSIQDYNKI